MSKRYRKKPVEVEAVQWTGENLGEIQRFLNHDEVAICDGSGIEIAGEHTSLAIVRHSEWLVRRPDDTLATSTLENFSATYEPVEEETGPDRLDLTLEEPIAQTPVEEGVERALGLLDKIACPIKGRPSRMHPDQVTDAELAVEVRKAIIADLDKIKAHLATRQPQRSLDEAKCECCGKSLPAACAALGVEGEHLCGHCTQQLDAPLIKAARDLVDDLSASPLELHKARVPALRDLLNQEYSFTAHPQPFTAPAPQPNKEQHYREALTEIARGMDGPDGMKPPVPWSPRAAQRIARAALKEETS